jgi:hypothetical protein
MLEAMVPDHRPCVRELSSAVAAYLQDLTRVEL